MNGRQALAAFVLSAALTGCQATLSDTHISSSEDRFRIAWTLYTRCLESTDPAAARANSDRLRRAVQDIDETAPTVPALVQRFVDKPPSRLAVDPKSLWAACTLHAARAAMAGGELPAAVRLLNAVVTAYPDTEYSYYVAQAHMTLSLPGLLADSSSSLRLVSAP